MTASTIVQTAYQNAKKPLSEQSPTSTTMGVPQLSPATPPPPPPHIFSCSHLFAPPPNSECLEQAIQNVNDAIIIQ